jgi:hypothetical protein
MMPTLLRPALGTTNNNFNTAEARMAYAHHYRAIGIPAVAAGAHSMRKAVKAPLMTDIPAILRGPVEND